MHAVKRKRNNWILHTMEEDSLLRTVIEDNGGKAGKRKMNLGRNKTDRIILQNCCTQGVFRIFLPGFRPQKKPFRL